MHLRAPAGSRAAGTEAVLPSSTGTASYTIGHLAHAQALPPRGGGYVRSAPRAAVGVTRARPRARVCRTGSPKANVGERG